MVIGGVGERYVDPDHPDPVVDGDRHGDIYVDPVVDGDRQGLSNVNSDHPDPLVDGDRQGDTYVDPVEGDWSRRGGADGHRRGGSHDDEFL